MKPFTFHPRLLLLTTGLACAVGAGAQNPETGDYQYYAGIRSVQSNPALIAGSPYKWNVNLFSVGVNAGGTNASIGLGDYLSINQSFIKNKLISRHERSTVDGSVNLQGPSLSVRLGRPGTIGLTTRGRIFLNGYNIDGRIVSELDDAGTPTVAHPYKVSSSEILLTTTAFYQVGLVWAKEVPVGETSSLLAGISANYLSGSAHTDLRFRDIDATVNYSPAYSEGYLTNARAGIQTRVSGEFYNDISLGNLLKKQGSGFGIDAGLVFEYKGTAPSAERPFRFRAGLSVTDVGSIRYTADSAYSKSYQMNVPANQQFYFKSPLKANEFSHAAKTFDNNPWFFTRTAREEGAYTIQLPSVARLFADYRFGSGFFLQGAAAINLRNTIDASGIRTWNRYSLMPGWENRRWSVSVPGSYNSLTGLNVGAAFRIGTFAIGSASILSTALGKGKQMDGYLGLSFGLTNREVKQKKSVDAFAPAMDTASATGYPGSENPYRANLEAQLSGTSASVPFWLRANRYGSIPLSGFSGSLIGAVARNYQNRSRFFDWGFAFEGRGNAGNGSNFTIIEGYAKIKLGTFQLKAGRSRDIMGFTDSTLSSGSFAISGNALGVPKVELSVPEFTHLFGGRLLAFKGTLAHGWMGEKLRNKISGSGTAYDQVFTYFHQKSFYGRLGKDHWKVRFYGGFNHQVTWGNEKIRYGSYYSLSQWQTFLYVLKGQKWEGISSKIGNHLGTIDLGLELNVKPFSILVYRQNFYEVGGLYYLANIKDGLHGVSIRNKKPAGNGLRWKKILFEFLYTKSQAGEPSAPNTPTGSENYYNSSEYIEGWSYKGLALGTPFITAKATARPGQASSPYEFFINNRLTLLHTGLEGSFHPFSFVVKLSYSKNEGTWNTNKLGSRWGGPNTNVNPPIYGIFKAVSQFSSYVEIQRPLSNGLRIGGAFALDHGQLLNNAVGAEVRVAKSF